MALVPFKGPVLVDEALVDRNTIVEMVEFKEIDKSFSIDVGTSGQQHIHPKGNGCANQLDRSIPSHDEIGFTFVDQTNTKWASIYAPQNFREAETICRSLSMDLPSRNQLEQLSRQYNILPPSSRPDRFREKPGYADNQDELAYELWTNRQLGNNRIETYVISPVVPRLDPNTTIVRDIDQVGAASRRRERRVKCVCNSNN